VTSSWTEDVIQKMIEVVVPPVGVGVVLPPPSGATAWPVAVEIMPGHRLRLRRFDMICGIAAMVVAYASCMRMTWPFCNRPAACTICAVLAPFQSCESTSQITSVRPREASTERRVALVSP